MGVVLLVVGCLLELLVLGLAFTVYGMISAAAGLACIAGGTALVARRADRRRRGG